MIRAFMVVAALSLVLPSMSMAQQRPPDAGQSGKPGGRPEMPNNRPSNPGRPNPPAQPNRPARPQPARPQPPRPQPPRPQPARPTPPQAGRPGNRPRPIAQPQPPRGNQFWHRGRYYSRIRGPAFAYPPGYQYRRWSIGVRLPPVLIAPSFYYTGWAALGLQQPLPGYSWVRFGPDLLLVNLTTYEVEDVVYGVFQ